MKRSEFEARLGQPFGPSRWFEMTQARIDAHADISEDWQFIHVDPVRAAQGPFGSTIAHGFLTLSLLSAMAYDAIPEMEGQTQSVNYGMDRMRFLAPVRAGARIRGRFVLERLEERVPGEITLTWDTSVEIEGEERPALIATWINRKYLERT